MERCARSVKRIRVPGGEEHSVGHREDRWFESTKRHQFMKYSIRVIVPEADRGESLEFSGTVDLKVTVSGAEVTDQHLRVMLDKAMYAMELASNSNAHPYRYHISR